ncbi:replication initiation protein RepC [Nitrobacter hamburgensis]|uniref:replication initiation protein RepC n=1 Tax=Nitrobacter hamburgensis TaxID=912 RepID=UPI003D3145B6
MVQFLSGVDRSLSHIADYARRYSHLRILSYCSYCGIDRAPLARHQPSAWNEACTAMGDGQASVVLAAILLRGAAIESPGGDLRNLGPTHRSRGILGLANADGATPARVWCGSWARPFLPGR